MLLMGHDLPYVGKRLEEQGYKREKDVLAYLYDTEQDMPVAVRRLIDRSLPANVTLRHVDLKRLRAEVDALTKHGNASCRERVCQYVKISVVAVTLKKKNKTHSKHDNI